MLRAVLALLLIAFVGALGFYFWQAGGAEQATRARVIEQPAPTPPAINTGTGANPAVPAKDNEVIPAPPATEMAAATPPAIDTGAGAPPAAPPAETQVPAQHRTSQAELVEPADPGPLAQRGIGLPIANLTLKDVHDTFNQDRAGGERRHEATDIMAPKGTPVVAVENGVIAKLFTSKPGGLTVYQYDPEEKFVFYYAHLDRYADGLKEGMLLRKGQLVGYVGVTGNSDPDAPHLHFAILQLGPEKRWWENTRPVDPYPLLTKALTPRTTSRGKRKSTP